MMSPVTSRAETEVASDISDLVEGQAAKKEVAISKTPVEATGPGTLKVVHRNRSGAAKIDAAIQALNEQSGENEATTYTRTKRSNSKASSNGRASEESVRSEGRKSNEGRRSQDGSSHRRSAESQRSVTTETGQQDETADQLTQITDILLARLITTLSDSTLGNPALLLQTLLGFSPDDYNDLLAALSESRLSYVDIISAYLHNIKVMSEDSGSTSAALSGTLARSLIEQYNSLLAQAVKSPQSIARAALIGETDGRSHLADLLQKANAADSKPDRRSFESLLPKGPSGLGFGRRHSAESNKQRQSSLIPPDPKATTQSMTEGAGMMDFSKLFGNTGPKLPDMASGGLGNITQEQLAALISNAGMFPNDGSAYTQAQQQQPNVPSLPCLPNTVGSMNGMLTLTNPYAMHQMQPWTVPMQQMTGATNRGGLGWQGAPSLNYPPTGNLFRGWGGLETVHENFHGHLAGQDATFFPQAINMQPQHGQQ